MPKTKLSEKYTRAPRFLSIEAGTLAELEAYAGELGATEIG